MKLKYPNAKTERPSSFKVTYTITDPKDPRPIRYRKLQIIITNKEIAYE
ncbi:hypothetical protein [Weissella viridescens]